MFRSEQTSLPRTPDDAMMEDFLHEMASKYPDLKDELYRAIVEDTKTELSNA